MNVDIYNNHFFDSGMRVFFLKELGPNKVLTVSYFIHEVDELKKGPIVRMILGKSLRLSMEAISNMN